MDSHREKPLRNILKEREYFTKHGKEMPMSLYIENTEKHRKRRHPPLLHYPAEAYNDVFYDKAYIPFAEDLGFGSNVKVMYDKKAQIDLMALFANKDAIRVLKIIANKREREFNHSSPGFPENRQMPIILYLPAARLMSNLLSNAPFERHPTVLYRYCVPCAGIYGTRPSVFRYRYSAQRVALRVSLVSFDAITLYAK